MTNGDVPERTRLSPQGLGLGQITSHYCLLSADFLSVMQTEAVKSIDA